MNDVLRSPVMASTIATAYAKDGYCFPYDVISETEAAELLADLEAAEAEVADDRARNGTDSRRVGIAIRFVAPSMKQISGDKLLVSHVSGKDEYGHFDVMPPPAGRLLEEDFDRARRNTEMKRDILYQGVKPELVKGTRRA